MSQLLTGTVTLLFTDIEGSTRLLQRLGHRYAEVRADFERLTREVVAEHNGFEVDTQGDSFFVCFPTARDAVQGAVALQRAFATHDWPDGEAVRVRMGLHTGEPRVAGGHYVGLTVNRAARVMGSAAGGQILVTDATRRMLAESDLDSGIRLRDLGVQQLKDFPERERLFQVEAPGLQARFPRVGRRRRWLGLAAAAVAVAVVAVAAVVAVGRGDANVVVRPNTVALIDPATNEVTAQIDVGQEPTSVASGAGAVWVVNEGDATVSRIDPVRRVVVRDVAVPGAARVTNVVTVGRSVWVTRVQGELLAAVRINADFDTVAGEVSLGRYASARFWALAAGGGSVWAAQGGGDVARISPESRRVVRRYFTGLIASALAFGDGRLWVAGGRTVVPVDPATGESGRPIDVGGWPTAIAVGGGAVWVASGEADLVDRWDIHNRTHRTIEVGDQPVALAYGAGSVWVANARGRTVARLDAETGKVVATISLDASPRGIALGPHGVWVTVAGRQAGSTRR